MRATSRESLRLAAERLEPLLTAESAGLGEELFSVAVLLDSSVALRRSLTDPARSGEAKAQLSSTLLRGRVSDQVLDVVGGLARSPWDTPRDLADAVERLGAVALVAAAEYAGRLDDVEDDLFRFTKIVAGDALQNALSMPGTSAESRARLVERLIGDKVGPETLALAIQAVAHPHGLRATGSLQAFQRIAAERRARLVTTVTTARPLTSQQSDRLRAALSRIYGRHLQLNEEVDPAVIGGIRIRIGDEVVDDTVLRRLDDARRSLVG